MQESADQSTHPTALNCLEGRPAPPMVVEGWKQLRALPRPAWEPFWLLLAPVLMNPGHTANKELISLFCQEHKIQPEGMLVAIGCCELLLKQAAAMDLEEEQFHRDLTVLSGEETEELARFIIERFPKAKLGLRRKMLEESLTAHGKLMTGLEWRLDRVQHSSTGHRLDTDIVLLTLHYREGRKEDRITLQLTKEAAQEIKRFSARLPDTDSE